MNSITHTVPHNKTIKICLNMIVKNESRIIERLLSSVVNIIDCYCIEDTGSTDNTKDLITTFFKNRGIPGKIIDEPFRNFAYNRTHAIMSASGMSDYLLFIDSDMIFTHKLSKNEIIEKLVKHDVFHVFQGSDTFYYKNVRFARNSPDCKYITPTHEYFSPPSNWTYGFFTKDEIFIDDRGDGGSKGNKTSRDIKLLTDELINNPNDERCLFYLANSYRDNNETDLAIEYYHKRVKVGGWIEEQWQSLHNIANIYKKRGEIEKAVYYWLEAYNIYPKRIENLHKLIEHYRSRGNNNIAYHFWKLADHSRKTYTNWGDYLFLHRDVYDFKLDYELSIIGYYCNLDKYDLKQICMKVISHPCVEDSTIKNVLSNYKFYTQAIFDKHDVFNKQTESLLNIGNQIMSLDNYKDFTSSTPSICFYNGNERDINATEMVVCVRYVNYLIDEKGRYINKEHITTHNIIATVDIKNDNWYIKNEKLLKYNDEHDCRYVGLEDVRLFNISDKEDGKIIYNANRGLNNGSMTIEHGKINIFDGETQNSILLTSGKFQRNTEKNWVLFSDSKSNIKCVYGWNPLIIGDINTNTGFFNITPPLQNSYLPKFFENVRGSSNGVNVGNGEIWFLCHIVSYEDRRYYYHLFIVIDSETYKVIKWTQLFTFHKQKIEYSLGFVFFSQTNKLLIGYSTMDNTTKYAMLNKNIIDDMMILSP